MAQAHENHSLGTTNDCTDITVDYKNNPNLTRQEKIELMDKALLHSLSKYEGCQNIRTKSAASGGGAAGGSQGGGADGGAGNSESGSSTASSEMSGTQTPVAQKASTDNVSEKETTSAPPANEHAAKGAQNKLVRGGGKVPDDIPKVDNDSVLEAQIRQAAMSETDPAIKAKLWNEYRKYKGLPVQ